jgi:ApbE superfamily uncharacterized protein (UPF0280 family)
MAIPTPVNGQITDSITQAQHLSVGSASAVAVASALQSMAHAAGISMLNASQSYQQWSITHRAATTQAVVKLLSPGN